MTQPPPSGTVSTFRYNQRQVIDHAMRRAGKSQTNISAEQLSIATELIYTITSQWINAGFPLWTREFLLLGVSVGQTDVVCPLGTVDVFHSYWRILQPWRGQATTSAGGGAAQLFGGQPNPDVAIAGTNPGVWANFGGAMEVDTVGILTGGTTTFTAALQLQTSPDGSTWTTVQILPSATYAPQQWVYFDLSPSITSQFLQIILPSATATTWTLNQLNFGLANGQDIEIGPLNIDDYWNLPDKAFQSDRPNSSYVDRQLNAPVIKVWPTPNQGAFYNGTVTALVRRYIQDPGSLTNGIEVPQRALEALQWRLAKLLMFELPDEDSSSQASYFSLMAKQQRMQAVDQEATKAEALFWAEERTRAPLRLTPNIRGYTS